MWWITHVRGGGYARWRPVSLLGLAWSLHNRSHSKFTFSNSRQRFNTETGIRNSVKVLNQKEHSWTIQVVWQYHYSHALQKICEEIALQACLKTCYNRRVNKREGDTETPPFGTSSSFWRTREISLDKDREAKKRTMLLEQRLWIIAVPQVVVKRVSQDVATWRPGHPTWDCIILCVTLRV